MQLERYLDWLSNLLDSRRDSELEHFRVDFIEPGRKALIEGRLRFWDGSLLKFVEVLQQHGAVVGKLEYVYHYQDRENRLIFRYDNAPHHREIATSPHHKHVGKPGKQAEEIEASTPPSIDMVMSEIASFLYPKGE